MSSTRDNPLARFSAFVWGIGTFLLFVVGLAVIYLFSREDPVSLEDSAAAKRYETKAKVFATQDSAVGYKEIEAGKKVQVPPHDVFDLVGKQLASTKAAATKTVVPGSKTEADQAALLTVVDPAVVDKMDPKDGDPIDPAVMEAGKAQYILCAACHGQNGEGTPAGPAHAGSEWITGPRSNLIRIQLRGLTGPIHVKGELFSTIPMMTPQNLQTDEQIAHVLTYVRNSFGNKGSAVSPEQVKALRSEVGKPMLTEADLIKP
ncbi:cytochrome c [Luteolibacter ambystomatis]|uniref:Cytochrome c n=1 Tax=Luteolibacter ambystomatis TaxID=2824561 RepID=A0A975G6I2_9BACT|nr:cytochrome c [Luteolibacter ambystomatis]QUE49863.1 cytochrome c [Luteolibacter ambystomatis]